MRRLFIDTAGWMAMADAKDPNHVQCIQFRDWSLEQGTILVTSDYIVDETLTLIRMRLGIDAAQKWWNIVSGSPRCRIEWISPVLAREATDFFFHWRDQNFSFTDCTSFILMRAMELEDVMTTDHHFTIAGFLQHP